jgi:hypothetical protein
MRLILGMDARAPRWEKGFDPSFSPSLLRTLVFLDTKEVSNEEALDDTDGTELCSEDEANLHCDKLEV